MTLEDEARQVSARDKYLDDEYFTPTKEIRAARNITRWLVAAATFVFSVIAWWLI